MRQFPEHLTAKLKASASQWAHAWIVKRQDGVTLGFTDHDQDLVIEGVSCVASTGLEAKDMTSELGLAPGGGDVMGALQDASITEADVLAGLYDGAEVMFYLCEYEPPFETILLDVTTIGEIKRDEVAFVAELRGATHRLSEETGRIFQKKCDADFGDARCGMDLNRSDLRAVGRVDAVLAQGRYRVSGLEGFSIGAFTNGRLNFSQWPGKPFAIQYHSQVGQAVIFEIWDPPQTIQNGDQFEAIVGCDKSFESCTRRFNNGVNFRGFPHMPGNEIVLTIVQDGDPGYDGRSLFHD